MFRRQKFAVAGVVTKAAAKAAEKIKKINKKDKEKFGASFYKMKRMQYERYAGRCRCSQQKII